MASPQKKSASCTTTRLVLQLAPLPRCEHTHTHTRQFFKKELFAWLKKRSTRTHAFTATNGREVALELAAGRKHVVGGLRLTDPNSHFDIGIGYNQGGHPPVEVCPALVCSPTTMRNPAVLTFRPLPPPACPASRQNDPFRPRPTSCLPALQAASHSDPFPVFFVSRTVTHSSHSPNPGYPNPRPRRLLCEMP